MKKNTKETTKLMDRVWEALYNNGDENAELPYSLRSEEHTAQLSSNVAQERQNEFKMGSIHLLSSSTTFEVGVDLGDLEITFLRNVPPEPFNYTQRVGRAGRRNTQGLAITYCRRNPHDLYHYENPEERIINSTIHPPRLQVTNEKIILRHVVATVLSAFFKENEDRFKNVKSFIHDWENPAAKSELFVFCKTNNYLKRSLRAIIPQSMHNKMGIDNDSWIDKITGPDSRLANVESEVCGDYHKLEELRQEHFTMNKGTDAIEKRIDTISGESALNFLSRKAVIPKYGFPVDVVELETDNNKLTLQRDLSQAIAEYAAGSKIIANKLEWVSSGIKIVKGKNCPIQNYTYHNAYDFQKLEDAQSENSKKYLIPIFGFVAQKKPKIPNRRTQRLYTTQPFFDGFRDEELPQTTLIDEIKITRASPGTLVILCEGKKKQGFYICRSCGAHFTKPQSSSHKTPWGSDCECALGKYSLGHELVTDVVRLQFPGLCEPWQAYSVAYSIMLGASAALSVPDRDLNVTIAKGENPNEIAIILYDNVPGGAGLVAQLEDVDIFRNVLAKSKERVEGGCGCDSSCYGCLRSYRNQFAHPHLNRIRALTILEGNPQGMLYDV